MRRSHLRYIVPALVIIAIVVRTIEAGGQPSPTPTAVVGSVPTAPTQTLFVQLATVTPRPACKFLHGISPLDFVFVPRGPESDPLLYWRNAMQQGRAKISKERADGCDGASETIEIGQYARLVVARAFELAPAPADFEAMVEPFAMDLVVNPDPAAQLQDQKNIDELVLNYQTTRQRTADTGFWLAQHCAATVPICW